MVQTCFCAAFSSVLIIISRMPSHLRDRTTRTAASANKIFNTSAAMRFDVIFPSYINPCLNEHHKEIYPKQVAYDNNRKKITRRNNISFIKIISSNNHVHSKIHNSNSYSKYNCYRESAFGISMTSTWIKIQPCHYLGKCNWFHPKCLSL